MLWPSPFLIHRILFLVWEWRVSHSRIENKLPLYLQQCTAPMIAQFIAHINYSSNFRWIQVKEEMPRAGNHVSWKLEVQKNSEYSNEFRKFQHRGEGRLSRYLSIFQYECSSCTYQYRTEESCSATVLFYSKGRISKLDNKLVWLLLTVGMRWKGYQCHLNKFSYWVMLAITNYLKNPEPRLISPIKRN